MTLRAFLLISLCFVARSELVFKRNCGIGVPFNCRVTSVDVENCSHAPRFCRVAYGKRYPITVSFVPNFTADNLVLNTMVDLKDNGAYYLMRSTGRVCEDHLLVCPLEPEVKQTLNFDFHMSEDLSGSVPIIVNLMNAANHTESCCFSFRVKAAGPMKEP